MKKHFYEYRGDGVENGDIIASEDLKTGTIVKSNDYNIVGIKVDIFETKDLWILSNEEMISKGLSYLYDLDNFVDTNTRGDGGSTQYYKLPENAMELGDLIHHKKMNHSIGEAFCALYRLEDNGERKRNLRKVQYYIEQELSRC